MKYVPLVEDGL